MARTEFTLETNAVLTDDEARFLKSQLRDMFTLLRPLNEQINCEYKIVAPTLTVLIKQDIDCEDPLEDGDGFFIMHCWHKRYKLGHKDAADPYEETDGVDDTGGRVLRKDVVAILPLYLYDHSGITMRTSPFSCGFDSGQVGWIYCTKESLKGWNFDNSTSIADRMRKFVEQTYDQYLQGNCWWFSVIDENGDIVDSCSGFIGDELEETGILDHISQELHEAAKKAWENRYESSTD